MQDEDVKSLTEGVTFSIFWQNSSGQFIFYSFWFSAAYLTFFSTKNPQCYPVPEWQFKRCSNILEHLSLDFFFPKGQDFIHLPVTLDRAGNFRGMGSFCCNSQFLPFLVFSITLSSNSSASQSQEVNRGVGRKKIDSQKENINHTA